ncbi:hypothetical protein XVE_0134 [Xanthomonas vesicatoria ATCC 35937]|uniref:Uncharacterized protein n=1 Tax=Xanthomonas vesicatoria ATCC 35937 TaxID=925775 RepID=F0B7U0_9XANT|nr:hypothetical protein XVE_0134 [Xanthomonas vesicatoria ATCC 35937]
MPIAITEWLITHQEAIVLAFSNANHLFSVAAER